MEVYQNEKRECFDDTEDPPSQSASTSTVCVMNGSCTPKSNKDGIKNVLKNNEKKCEQIKDLMNCIAYDKESNSSNKESNSEVRYSDDFDSLSSDTTSDITDVSSQVPSPPPSSSGCSSFIKTDIEIEMGKESRNRDSRPKEPRYKESQRKSEEHKGIDIELDNTFSNSSDTEDSDGCSLTILKDALQRLDCGSIRTNYSSCMMPYQKQRNLTFNRERLRSIDRENLILLKKIQSYRRKPKQEQFFPRMPRVASSAINRQKQQQKIEFENSILLKKIERVKGTTNSISHYRRF